MQAYFIIKEKRKHLVMAGSMCNSEKCEKLCKQAGNQSQN